MRTYERLNAEVVKFEAQDVITASVAAPSAPESVESTTICICNTKYDCDRIGNGKHGRWLPDGKKWFDLDYIPCEADEHFCK